MNSGHAIHIGQSTSIPSKITPHSKAIHFSRTIFHKVLPILNGESRIEDLTEENITSLVTQSMRILRRGLGSDWRILGYELKEHAICPYTDEVIKMISDIAEIRIPYSSMNKGLDITIAQNPFLRLDYASRSTEINISQAETLLVQMSVQSVMDALVNKYIKLRQKEELEKSLRDSYVDNLTGIGNRTGLYKLFSDLEGDLELDSFPVSILFLDLDDFKKQNDNFGHHAGDTILKSIGDLLDEYPSYPARLGGDEFVMVFSKTSTEDAYKIGVDINQRLASTKINDQWIQTASIGVATAFSNTDFKKTPINTRDGYMVLANADKALYGAKAKDTKNTCVVFDSTLHGENGRKR